MGNLVHSIPLRNIPAGVSLRAWCSHNTAPAVSVYKNNCCFYIWILQSRHLKVKHKRNRSAKNKHRHHLLMLVSFQTMTWAVYVCSWWSYSCNVGEWVHHARIEPHCNSYEALDSFKSGQSKYPSLLPIFIHFCKLIDKCITLIDPYCT